MTKLRRQRVLAWRMARQRLVSRGDEPLAVAGAISGLHAQLAASAELTLWARTSVAPGDVARWLWEDRALVKTWTLRGTLHLVPAGDLGLWVAAQSALKPRHHVGSWQRHWGLTLEQADAMLDAIPAVLDGRELTREELAVAVAGETGIDGLDGKLRGGFGDLLKPAAFRGDLCFAPSHGRNVRFARPDQWLGPWEPLDQDEAVREITRRYLGVYGPANREALARWFGMTSPAQAGRWLAGLGDEAATVSLDGEELVMLAADVDACAAAEPSGAVRLLPAFDHHVVAAARDALPEADRACVYRPQGWLSPVLLVDGVIAGVWSHEVARGRLEVEVEPFGRVKKAVRAGAEAEAAALAEFLQADDVTVRWASPARP